MGPELTPVPLRLGPLAPPGYLVRRSGIRWLREDGALCRPGEAIAFCNIGLTPEGESVSAARPFAEEWLDVQAVLAPRIGGRLRRSDVGSYGGFLDQLDHFQHWGEDFVLGHIEPAETGAPALAGAANEVEIFMTAGRRHADLSEGRQGILTGWHDRTRAWRASGEDQPVGGLLSLGVCEMEGVVRGESSAFLELFEAISGPAHAVYIADEPLVPCARIVREQTARSQAERQAIADDLVGHFARARAAPSEWIFAGALLNALRRAPLADTYEILTRTGLARTGPVDAVVLSASAEAPTILRHKKLGYAVQVHGYRAHRAGPTVLAWLYGPDFERVTRSLDDIADDYRTLIDGLAAEPGRLPRQALIVNMMSTMGEEEVQIYDAFDEPMRETLVSIHGKDVNLMLHDVARETGAAIVDLDAITAEIGGQRNLPDGLHSSGLLQSELRAEILHILRARGVPGFGPALGA